MSTNIFRKNIKIANSNHAADNIVIDRVDSHIPRNMTTCICGKKGSGKTTLLRSIIETCYKHKIFKHIYFIYANSIDDDMPSYIIRIPVAKAEDFIDELLMCKSLYNSYNKFIEKINIGKLDKKSLISADDFLREYTDNVIYQDNINTINSRLNDKDKITKIIKRGYDIMKTYGKSFTIQDVLVDGFKFDDNDCIVIDDIAIAAPILFKSIQKSRLYKYFTLTRHINTAIILSGQDIKQVPAPIRREITCWLLSSNTIIEPLRGIISNYAYDEIEKQQQKLKDFEFVVYNDIEQEINTI